MAVDLLITIGGFLLFAFVHSMLANRNFKEKLLRRWPFLQSSYRTLYTLVSLITLGLWYLFSPFPDGLLYSIPMPYSYLFRGVQLVGIAGIYLSLKPIGALNFLIKTQYTPGSDSSDKQLMTSGLYQYIRHPLYSSSMLILLFNPTMSARLGVITILFGLYFWIGSFLEERNLRAEFGEAYERYQREVPRFIPKIPLS